MSDDTRRIGEIVGFHGLDGSVKVKTADHNPAWQTSLKRMLYQLNGQQRWLTIAKIRQKNPNHLIVRFNEFVDRTDAERQLGRGQLFAAIEELPQLEVGEAYADDLIGLTVIDQDTGTPLGTVKDLLTAAGRDYLEIAVTATGKTEVVPYNHHFFPDSKAPEGQLLSTGLGEFLGEVS